MRDKLLALLTLTLLSGCASQADKGEPCGWLSAYLEPPQSQHLYHALVTHINGEPVISQPNYRLAPGSYELTLVELIDAPELTVQLASRQAKTMVVEILGHQRAHIAAEYAPKMRGGEYWQGAVWQWDEAKCYFPIKK